MFCGLRHSKNGRRQELATCQYHLRLAPENKVETAELDIQTLHFDQLTRSQTECSR